MKLELHSKAVLSNIDSPVIFTDKEGLVIWVNPSFERNTGYALDEMMGKKPGAVLQGGSSDPDTIKVMSEAVKNGEGFEVEILNFTKEGKPYLASINCEPVRDEKGRLQGFVSIQPVINRRGKRELRQLKERSKVLQAVFNHSNVAIIIANDDMQVVDVNPAACRLIGYSAEEFKSMKVMDYSRSMTQAEPLWDEFMEESIQVGTIELLHKNGSVVKCEYNAVANVVEGLHLSVILDITEKERHLLDLKSKSAELEIANADKNTILSILSHDLRSPLGRLRAILDLSTDGAISQSEFQELSVGLSQNLDANKNLLDNLLFWAQSQQKGFKAEKEDCQLSHCAEQQLVHFEAEAKAKGIELRASISKNLKVRVDPNMLELVIRNLCNNALKFCSSGNWVMIKALKEGDRIRILVEDNGPGIPKDKQGEIFKNGYSTKGSANESGSGLGLSLCQRFLTLNDSKLELSSEEGQGSSFSFSLKSA